jgi:hypothetical protein
MFNRNCSFCEAALVRREGERADSFKKRRSCGAACKAGAHSRDYPWFNEAEEMWDAGVSASAIAEKFGVTKNVIIGFRSRRGWLPHNEGGGQPSTLFTRLDAVHAKFDRTMAELNRNKSRYHAAE